MEPPSKIPRRINKVDFHTDTRSNTCKPGDAIKISRSDLLSSSLYTSATGPFSDTTSPKHDLASNNMQDKTIVDLDIISQYVDPCPSDNQKQYQPNENTTDASVPEQRVAEIGKDYSYLPGGTVNANISVAEEWLEFDRTIISFMTEQRIPGLSLALKLKGAPIHLQTYGCATADTPVLPHHLFRIASVSKILTSIGIMKLYEAGKLKLNSKVFGPKGILSEYKPGAAGDSRLLRITVNHLLQHSGGWDRDIVGDACFWKGVDVEMGVPGPVNQHQLITYMMGQKLQFSPGARYAYSNLGYIILGRIIERVSEMSYEAYIKSILYPIGVHNVYLGKTKREHAYPDEVEYFATLKEKEVDSVFHGEGKVAAPYGGFSVEYGDSDGGWVATSEDLVKILASLDGTLGHRIIKDKTFRKMLAKPPFNKKAYSWYGLGLDVINWGKSKFSWNHGGHMEGSTSCLARNSQGLIFAILCNYWPPDSDYVSLVEYALHRPSFNMKMMEIGIPCSVSAATTDKKYLVRIQMNEIEFKVAQVELKQQNYALTWLNSYVCQNEIYYNGVWSNQQNYQFYFNLTESEMAELRLDMISKRLFPVHVEACVLCNNVCFSVLVTAGSDNSGNEWIIKSKLDHELLGERLKEWDIDDFIPVNVSTFTLDSVVYNCVLLHKSKTEKKEKYWFYTDLTDRKYETLFNKHARWGHLLSYLYAYKIDSKVNFTAIWSDSGSYMYASEHNMSKNKLLVDFQYQAGKKFVPKMICGYEEEENFGHLYAAVYNKHVKQRTK